MPRKATRVPSMKRLALRIASPKKLGELRILGALAVKSQFAKYLILSFAPARRGARDERH